MADLKTKLPRQMFETLKKGGVSTVEQVVIMSDYELLRIGNLSLSNIKFIKETASKILMPEPLISAYNLSSKDALSPKITWGCPIIDKVFSGGLRRGTLTEIHGESGCGKTQIALQAASAQWECGAVYICTEDMFPSKRLQQMFSQMFSDGDVVIEDWRQCGDKIFVLQLTEMDDLKRCIKYQLPRLLQQFPSISLVVVDSIAAPFRGEFQGLNSMVNRARHLKEIGFNLVGLSKTYNLAVLCINQVSAVVDSTNSATVTPCLGLAWSNMLTSRFKVEKINKYCHNISKQCIHGIKPHGDLALPAQTLRGVQILEESELMNSLCGMTNKDDILNSEPMLQVRKMSSIFSPDMGNNAYINYVINMRGVVGLEC